MASYKQLPDKSWEVKISWMENGKRRYKQKRGFKRKAEAIKFERDFMSELDMGIKKSKNPTFADYFEDWFITYKEKQTSPATQRRYRYVAKTLRSYFADTLIADIDRYAYQKFINEYGANHAKVSVSKLNVVIRACVKNAVYDDIIRKDFTHNIEITYDKTRDKHVEYLSAEELTRLTSECISGLNRRYTSRYMILTAIGTGMRISEIMALTWQDIDFKHQTITINKSWEYISKPGFKPTKNKSSNRMIKVNQSLLSYLKQLKTNQTDMVFQNQRGTIPTSNACNKTLRELLAKCGIIKQGFHFHSLRHAHVAYLLSEGVDIYAISKRLGHSDLSTTMNVYAYLIDEYKARNDLLITSKISKLF